MGTSNGRWWARGSAQVLIRVLKNPDLSGGPYAQAREDGRPGPGILGNSKDGLDGQDPAGATRRSVRQSAIDERRCARDVASKNQRASFCDERFGTPIGVEG